MLLTDHIIRPVRMAHGFFFEPPEDFNRVMEETRRYPICRRFNDMDDFIRYLDQKNKYRNAGMSDHGFGGAMNMLKNGWPEPVDALMNFYIQFNERLGAAVETPTFAYGEVGDEVDVDRYLAGEPEHMLGWADGMDGKRFVRIVVNTTFNNGMSEANFRRGAIVCAMSDAIERYGWRTEIVAASGVACAGKKGYSMPWELHMPVKRADQPLVMERLTFPLMHGSWDRQLIFRAQEQEQPPLQAHCVTGAGCYFGAIDVARESRGDIYLSAHNQDNFNNDQSSEAWALSELAKLGIKLYE